MGRKVLITGGLGFIGSNLVKMWLKRFPEDEVSILDYITYAARPEFLETEILRGSVRAFYHDIRNKEEVFCAMDLVKPDIVVHLAAESHVCNSIKNPAIFYETNVLGTFNLLEEFYQLHKEKCRPTDFHLELPDNIRFVHVSTDEVFGSLWDKHSKFDEDSQIKPRSPYAASKASSDHVALSYMTTYGLPVIVTNCSNNFGPNQHEEKLVPATINRILKGERIILHGKGNHIRDWIFVEDHCEALMTLIESKVVGRFCIGGEKELTNFDMVTEIRRAMEDCGLVLDSVGIEYTDGRPTDDYRYGVDCSKIKRFGWSPKTSSFEKNLADTVRYYMANLDRAGSPSPRGGLGEGVSDV